MRFRSRLAAPVLMTLGLAVPAAAEPPDATVRKVAAGLAAQQPEVVWQALPPSYQRDVTALVRDFGRNLDPSLHARFVTVGRRAVTVLRAKRDLVLSSQMAAGLAADRPHAEKVWDGVVGVLDTLMASELADLERLRTLDPAAFLRGTGSRVMQQVADASRSSVEDPYAKGLASLEGVAAEVVGKDGDVTVVRVTPTTGEAQDMRFVQVERCWVPEQLASSWATTIADARADVASMTTPAFDETRTQAMMTLAMVEGLLGQLEAMRTPEELDATLQGLASMLQGAVAQAAAPPAPTPGG